MARYSLNFGNKWQIKLGIGKECGFTSIFDISKPFARRKTELTRKKARANTLPHFEPPHEAPRGSIVPQNGGIQLTNDRSLEIFLPF